MQECLSSHLELTSLSSVTVAHVAILGAHQFELLMGSQLSFLRCCDIEECPFACLGHSFLLALKSLPASLMLVGAFVYVYLSCNAAPADHQFWYDFSG